MFDKEIVKKELKSRVLERNLHKHDFDQIVNGYELVDGLYIFRIGQVAFIFDENKLLDACPGYYSMR